MRQSEKAIAQSMLEVRMELPSNRRTTRPLRVLIVDDEPDTVLSTSILLQLYGHEILSASSGQQALDLVGAEHPHVVILDLAMPGFSGIALARCIRDSATIRRPFLIAHTGRRDPQTIEEVRAVGIDMLMFKPANMESLRSVLERFALLIDVTPRDVPEVSGAVAKGPGTPTASAPYVALSVRMSAPIQNGFWKCCICQRPWEVQCVAVEIRDDRRPLGIMCPACLQVRPGYLAEQMKEEAQILAEGFNNLRASMIEQTRGAALPMESVKQRAALAQLRSQCARLRQQCLEIRQNSSRLRVVTDQARREIHQMEERRQQLILECRRLHSKHPGLSQPHFASELAEAVEQFEATVVLADHFKQLDHWPISLKEVIQKERWYVSQRFLGLNSADLRRLVDDRYDEFFRTSA
jgi:CheY-like chemotaxis protein